MGAAPYITTIGHIVLLSLLLFGTSLYMLITISNRRRVRRVVTSWRRRWLCGGTSVPVGFTLLVVGAAVYTLWTDQPFHPILVGGYLASGIFWCVAAFLQQLVVISDYGIVRNIHRLNEAVAWGQIGDYFVRKGDARKQYVFLYRDGNGRRQRTSLVVPSAHADCFEDLVHRKLDARFNFSVERMYGKEAFDG